MKRFVISGAVLIFVAASAAVAKDKVEPRIESVLGCSSITDGTQRLSCYDTAMAGFRQALAAGQIVSAEEGQKPYAMEGVVKAAGPMGFNHYWVVMDSGDRWDVIAYGDHDTVPLKGAKVKIIKGFAGFRFLERNTPDRRAKYLGRD